MKFLITFIVGALAVGIGAFGAHALDKIMDSYGKEIFTTGSRYHFYHSLLMVGICLIIMNRGNHPLLNTAWFFALAGIILFSGSLYLLATRDGDCIASGIFGPLTPIGWLLLMTGWIVLAVYSLKDLN